MKRAIRRRPKGLILDTNLLLVFVLGMYDPLHIKKHKNTRGGYTPDDYYRLRDQLVGLHRSITTPHILTEVSNLLGQAPEVLKPSYFHALATVALQFEELHVSASRIFSGKSALTFGPTDLGILEIARSGHLVVTVDSRLADFLLRSGIHAVDYRMLRD